MKYEVFDKRIITIIIVNFFILPFLGWYFFSIFGCVLGIVIAYLIDRLVAKWAFDLTWNDIEIAINNQYSFGANGSLLCFKYDGKKMFIYRDTKNDKVRMGLRIPLNSFRDIFTKTDFEDITSEFSGWYIFDQIGRSECFSYFPNGGAKECFQILKKIIERAFGELHPKLAARIDASKGDIWEGRWK